MCGVRVSSLARSTDSVSGVGRNPGITARDGRVARGCCGVPGGGPGAFLTRGAEGLAPAAQVRKAVSVLALAALGAALLFSIGPAVSWIVFATGWLLFPTVGLLGRGLSGVARSGSWSALLPVGHAAPVQPAVRTAADGALAVARIDAAARRLTDPAARDGARRVHAAAEGVARLLLDLDGETVDWATERYLAPTAVLLERYAAFDGGRDGEEGRDAMGTVVAVERGLPAVAAKLDALRDELGGGIGRDRVGGVR